MTQDEIHNIWLHMSGKAEGLLEAGGTADFPVMFANAILEYGRKPWVGLTDEEVDECYYWKGRLWTTDELVRHVEAKLREKNA